MFHKSEIEKAYAGATPKATTTYADKLRTQSTQPTQKVQQTPPAQGKSPTLLPNANIPQLKTELTGCKDFQALIDKLFEWKIKDKEGCSLHPGLRHKFFNCFELCHVCDENNAWMDAHVKAKMRNKQRATRATKGEEALKKLNDKVPPPIGSKEGHPTP